MFESETYEKLLREVLDNAPEDIDTRQGSIFYDAVSGILLKIAKLYTDLDLIFSLSQIETAGGEYLDMKASEYGVERHDAGYAVYEAIVSGQVSEDNERFFYQGLYFILSGGFFTAEEPGTAYNSIYYGEQAVPVDSIPSLESAKFGRIVQYGTDAEDDESLRRRLKDKISGAGENGNKQHYRVWCESIDGVGKAKIYPLWNGPNTVKAVLISPDGLECSIETVDKVQKYVDPDTLGTTIVKDGVTYNVGDGLGEGTANIGAHFTAVSASSFNINISASAEHDQGASDIELLSEISKRISEYLMRLVMDTPDDEKIVVRISAVGAIIAGVEGIEDYRDLTMNGSENNVEIDVGYIPVKGEINIEFV